MMRKIYTKSQTVSRVKNNGFESFQFQLPEKFIIIFDKKIRKLLKKETTKFGAKR
jgi:hypothetical protein